MYACYAKEHQSMHAIPRRPSPSNECRTYLILIYCLSASPSQHALEAVGSIRHGLDVGVWHGIELRELELVLGPDLDEGPLVACAVTVMRCREDRDAFAVMFHFVTVHADFVRSNNGFQLVLFTEAFGHIGSELETNTALAWSSAWLGLRIRPEHLHHQSSLAGLPLLEAVEFAHIVQADVIVGEEATMEHKVFLPNQRGKGQGRERLGKELEHSFVVLGPALPFKAIHPIHVIGFVVAAVEEKLGRVKPLVSVE